MALNSVGCWNAFEDYDDACDAETKCMTGEYSLYDSRILGKIVSNRKVAAPAVSAVYSGDSDVAISVDESLTLIQFSEETVSSSVNFDARIDAMCFCGEEKMALVVDASGKLHIVSLDTMQVVLSHEVAGVKANSVKCCCGIVCKEDVNNRGVYCIAVALAESKITLFSNVLLRTLEEAHKTKDIRLMQSVQMSMKICTVDTSLVHGSVMTYMTASCSSYRYLTWGGSVLAGWDSASDLVTRRQSSNLRLQGSSDKLSSLGGRNIDMVKILQHSDYAFCLTNEGSLCLWNVTLMVLCKFWEGLDVKDFLIVDSSAGDVSIKLWAVVADKSSSTLDLCLLDVPSLTPIFKSTTAPERCVLACGLKFPDDVLYVDMDNLENGNSEIRLVKVSDASPEDRYKKLLGKRQFREAEEFARKYGLDLKYVYHQKAIHLAKDFLEAEEKGLSLSEIFKDLKDCLEKMEDQDVVAEICFYTDVPDLEMSYSLLMLGKSRLSTKLHNGNGDGMSRFNGNDLLLRIIERLDRLVSFRVAFAVGRQHDWVRFSRSNLSEELVSLLTKGNLYAAEVLMKRHQASLIDTLLEENEDGTESDATTKRLEVFMQYIPKSVGVEVLTRWLETALLPALLPKIRCGVKVIAAWLHVQAEAYERSDSSEWPENGLKMANVLFNFQRNLDVSNQQLAAACQEFRANSVEVEKLRLLVARLQKLLNLKRKFCCHVSLAEFVEETARSLTFRMLDRVMVPELIPSVLEKTVVPYMKENEFSEEDIFLGYIEDSLSRLGNQSVRSFESLRERRIVAIIECLKDKQVFMTATLKIAKHARCMWSESMHALVEKAMAIANEQISNKDADDPEVSLKAKIILAELENCKVVENMPIILSQYGLHDVDLRKPSTQQRIVRFLIRQGTKEALDQAGVFYRTYTQTTLAEFQRFRLIDALLSEKVDKCIELLDQVEKDSVESAIVLVKRAILFAEIRLEDDQDDSRIFHCDAAVAMIEHVVKKVSPTLEATFLEKLKMLKNISALQTRFGEYISAAEYSDSHSRTELLTKKLEESTDQEEENATQKDAITTLDSPLFSRDRIHSAVDCGQVTRRQPITSMGRLLELASLLGVEGDKVRLWLARNSVNNTSKGIAASMQICRELLHTSLAEDTADETLSIAMDAIRTLDLDSITAAADIFSVVAQAIMFCKPSNIGLSVEICYFHKFASEFIKILDNPYQNMLNDQFEDDRERTENLQLFYPWMEDDNGLLLKTGQVSPIFVNFTKALFIDYPPGKGQDAVEGYFARLQKSVFDLTGILKNAGRPNLAFSWTVKCVGLALRRLADLHNVNNDNESYDVNQLLLKTIDHLSSVLPDYVKECIRKTLRGDSIDVGLLSGLLTLLPISTVQSLLRTELDQVGNNPKRIMSIARAGVQILVLNSLHSEVHSLEKLFVDAQWSEKFKSLTIPFDRNAVSEQTGKLKTFRVLLHHPNSTGQMIKEFCLDYDLDVESSLLEYLRVLLADPSCIVADCNEQHNDEKALFSLNGMDAALVNFRYVRWNDSGRTRDGNTETVRSWEDVMKETAFVVENLRDRALLCKRLIHILRSETCPYSYRRAETILKLIDASGRTPASLDVEKGLELIQILSRVKRTAAVSEHERDYWSFPGVSRTVRDPPEIARERLPLHPFLFGEPASVWKILNPECNEHSVSGVVPIAAVLSLDVDKLYVAAVDNFIAKHMDSVNTTRLSINQKQFDILQLLAGEIKNPNLSTALAKRIGDMLPISERKVAAYNWSAGIAMNWCKNEQDADKCRLVTGTHRKLVELRDDVSMQLLLKEHGLLSKSSAMLTSSPKELIRFLYQHPSIIARYYHPDENTYPDILSATSAIAEYHSLNIFKMHLNLSIKFLQNSAKDEPSADRDLIVKFTGAPTRDCDLQSNASPSPEVIRVLYMLRNMEPNQTARALLRFISDRKNPLLTKRVHVQALRCILQLFDDAVIEERTRLSMPEFRRKVRIAVYISELETIGFQIEGPKLEKYRKEELVRSIYAIPKLRQDPRAICIAAEICREFNAWCPGTWQMLLQQLVVLKQIRYLRDLLPAICSHSAISSLPCLATVWQSCVTSPLAAMTAPLKDEEERIALDSYTFLLACPVLLEMDITCIVKSFREVGLPLFALGCLLIRPVNADCWGSLVKDEYCQIQKQLKKYPFLLGHELISEVMRAHET